MQELRPRGVTRNPVKAEMISQRRQETRVTCEVGHPPDEPFLVRIIPVVDAVVDYVILRKEESSYNKVQLTKISYDIGQSVETIT